MRGTNLEHFWETYPYLLLLVKYLLHFMLKRYIIVQSQGLQQPRLQELKLKTTVKKCWCKSCVPSTDYGRPMICISKIFQMLWLTGQIGIFGIFLVAFWCTNIVTVPFFVQKEIKLGVFEIDVPPDSLHSNYTTSSYNTRNSNNISFIFFKAFEGISIWVWGVEILAIKIWNLEIMRP